jgi:MFS family permease
VIDGPAGPEDEERDRSNAGRLRPTSAAAITAWAVVGLVGGWLLHPLAERVRDTAPIVTWAQPLALVLVTAILGATAYFTWRTVHVHHQRLDPHQAVNRLVLARACALVGALVAGGYLGYALSWVGVDTELGDQRMWRSAVAGLAGVAIVITALLLERACRVRSGEDDA